MKVCIVGCERSGTSAVSVLLSRASGLSLLDDPPESWNAYPKVFEKGYGISPRLWLKLRTHALVKVPGFATILPHLKGLWLGPFSVLYCIRDPRDVVASLLERLENGKGDRFTDVSWLGVSPGDAVEALAWRWRTYLECTHEYERSGGIVHYLRYEEFCADKLAAIESCAEVLRTPFHAERIEYELDRQYRKAWSNDIAGPGRWRRDLTARQVTQIEKICGAFMDDTKIPKSMAGEHVPKG